MKNKTLTFLLLKCLLILFAVYGCTLDPNPFVNEINGTVYKTDGQPLNETKVELILANTTFEAFTENNGKYSFKNISAGVGVLIFSKDQYITQKLNLKLNGEPIQTHNVKLLSMKDKSFLKLEQTQYIIDSQATDIDIMINSNVTFNISCQSDWITLPTETFHSNSEVITIHVQQNKTGEVRTSEIIFKGQYDLVQICNLIQNATSLTNKRKH